MYRIQNADDTYRAKRYPTEAEAIRALRRLKAEGSAVVWFNAGGVPKVWIAYMVNGVVEMTRTDAAV